MVYQNNLLAGGTVIDGKITNPALGDILNSKLTVSPEIYFQELIPKGIGWLFVFGGVSFFFMLVWGAVSWILSGGDKAHLESAKARITNAIIGLLLLVGAFAIVKLIERFFGINILSIDIGPLIIQ